MEIQDMIKIAIVEDEHTYAMQLQEYLHAYEKENGEIFEITLFSDGDEIVHKYKPLYDIILMDVEMKFMDGMSAAEEIRKVDTEVVIIFITNMPQYAIRGYAVDALDYVLKPVSYFAFSQRLNRAISRMKKRECKTLSISIKGGTVRLDAANITYIESQGHTLIFHTVSADYEMNGTMKELEKELKPLNFFRGNKGYLINLAHVDGIKDGCAVVRGEQILLSRARKKEFMETLTRYWGEVIK
jgi:DNA-binding LytR/AlgR family response regulator